MPAVRRTRLVEMGWKLHRALYRWSGGRIGARIGKLPVLLLTATGRRSGAPHTVALAYVPDQDRFVVVASNAGEDRDPSWWLNVKAHPEVTVQVGTKTQRVRASEANGPERERLWAELLRLDPSYDEYRRRTARPIPVVVLTPIGG